MSGRLGIDFGTSNTVVSVWNDTSNDANSISLEDFARIQEFGAEQIFSIPSLVHYGADFKYLFGNQVLKQNLYHSKRTFQWMKRYICSTSPEERLFDGRRISVVDAAAKYLSTILLSAASAIDLRDEEIAFTVPVEAYEDYSKWLIGVIEEAGFSRYRLIDEASAAALGYGIDVDADEAYCVFDFGGGTLDVAVVVLSEPTAGVGKRCRVLGKAGLEFGGTTIDEWIFQECLKQNRWTESDEDLPAISRMLLVECEKMKEKLSFDEHAELTVMNPLTGKLVHAALSRAQFANLLDEHNAYSEIDRIIRRALKSAQEGGFDDDTIKSVFLVGGGSQIPSVQNMIKRIFGKERVRMERPLDAVARGASALVAGRGFRDYIQHDYAIRYVQPETGKYEYRTIVRRGSAYPSTEPIAKLTIKASFDGQKKSGIPLFEIGSGSSKSPVGSQLYFDDDGIARVRNQGHWNIHHADSYWINESAPTFLSAEPPAAKGEACFRIEFGIDGNRRLLISAHDLKKDAQVLKNFPAAKLI